jgi:hypothetical protein
MEPLPPEKVRFCYSFSEEVFLRSMVTARHLDVGMVPEKRTPHKKWSGVQTCHWESGPLRSAVKGWV